MGKGNVERLPVELWEVVVGYLNVRSAARLLKSSRYLAFAAQRAVNHHPERLWPVMVIQFQGGQRKERKFECKESLLDRKTDLVVR